MHGEGRRQASKSSLSLRNQNVGSPVHRLRRILPMLRGVAVAAVVAAAGYGEQQGQVPAVGLLLVGKGVRLQVGTTAGRRGDIAGTDLEGFTVRRSRVEGCPIMGRGWYCQQGCATTHEGYRVGGTGWSGSSIGTRERHGYWEWSGEESGR